MKKKLGGSLLALLITFGSSVTLSTEVSANDTFTAFANTVTTVAEETYTASGNIDFTGTQFKFNEGTKPCCIGCFSEYVVAVAEDGTEYTATLTKTDDWAATWEVDGLADGIYTFKLSNDYDYYYAYTVTGSFTVSGKNVSDVALYIIDLPCTASGAILFTGTEGKFEDGTKPCCIGCFGEYIVVTNSNGVSQNVHFTKTDTWEGAWIAGDLENGEYTVSISNEYPYSDYYEIENGTFTIDNYKSLGALSLTIVDSAPSSTAQTTTTVESTVVTESTSNNETISAPTVVPSTMVELLSRLF